LAWRGSRSCRNPDQPLTSHDRGTCATLVSYTQGQHKRNPQIALTLARTRPKSTDQAHLWIWDTYRGHTPNPQIGPICGFGTRTGDTP
jgi:hypothetical protein